MDKNLPVIVIGPEQQLRAVAAIGALLSLGTEVYFPGKNADEVAEILAVAGEEHLIPQLAHVDQLEGGRLVQVAYTPQGRRVESPYVEPEAIATLENEGGTVLDDSPTQTTQSIIGADENDEADNDVDGEPATEE